MRPPLQQGPSCTQQHPLLHPSLPCSPARGSLLGARVTWVAWVPGPRQRRPGVQVPRTTEELRVGCPCSLTAGGAAAESGSLGAADRQQSTRQRPRVSTQHQKPGVHIGATRSKRWPTAPKAELWRQLKGTELPGARETGLKTAQFIQSE